MLSEVVKVAQDRDVSDQPEDRRRLLITSYLDETGLRFHDVDNRLKDIMDAPQGRAGGLKARRRLPSRIAKDHQVFRVPIEKMLPPGQSRGMGPLVIRRCKPVANEAFDRSR